MTKRFIILSVLAAFSPAFALAAEPTICTMQYAPVCAAKQVQCVSAPCYPVYQTYGNACTANPDDATFIHEGECTADESGPVKPAEPYQPPAGCTAWFDGCNSCAKGAGGAAACTLKACVGPTAPGYCTAYDKPAETTTTTVTTTVTTDDVSATTSATTTPPEEPLGFFARLWDAILGWFR